MLYKEIIDETIERLQKDKNDSKVRERVKQITNENYKFVANSADWKELQKYQEIRIIKDFTAGTVSITEESEIVSASGAVFTTDMAGRFFKTDVNSTVYRILYVDTANNQLILNSKVVDDTASGLEYRIFKKYYTLASNTRRILDFDINSNDDNRNFVQEGMVEDFNNSRQSHPYTEAGFDEFVSDYAAGTVTLTKNSDLATFTGSSLLSNVTQGDILTVQGVVYRIKRLETDLRARLLNIPLLDLPPTEFVISKDHPRQIEILFSLSDESDDLIIPISYISYVYDMTNEDQDRTELSDKFKETIIAFNESTFLFDKVDTRATSNNKRNVAQLLLNELKQNRNLVASSYAAFAPKIPEGFGRG